MLQLNTAELQRKVASEVIVQGMNVRQIERYVKEILSKDSSIDNSKDKVRIIKPGFQAEEETLRA